MSVFINKQLISFKNCFTILSQLYQDKGYKTILISNVSVGNMTLCHRMVGSVFWLLYSEHTSRVMVIIFIFALVLNVLYFPRLICHSD
jgi:hypothetical protein